MNFETIILLYIALFITAKSVVRYLIKKRYEKAETKALNERSVHTY